MTTLFILGMMFVGALFALVAVPLLLLKAVLGIGLAVVAIPLQIAGAIVGSLVKALAKATFWLLLLAIPLAIALLPLTILAFFGWLLYRLVRPRPTPQAYVVS